MPLWLRRGLSLNPTTGCAFLLVLASLLLSCSSARHGTYRDDQMAVASWYGAEFHGRPTASGEIFDMHRLTCAHREYPFGTLLTVTNLSNNKTVTCTVNDRGPFVSGRDIDLSYGAAQEIGMISPGIGTVRITRQGRDSAYVRTVRSIASRGPYTVQLGAFRDRENALHLKMSLALRYESVYIIEATVQGEMYHRVRIGKFRDKEDAYRLAKTVSEEGYSAVIMHYDESI